MTESFAQNAERPWHPTIEVRVAGPRTYEARTVGGLHSALGTSAKEAVENLRAKLPAHEEPVIMNIPLPVPDYSFI